MSLANTKTSYGAVARGFHWLTALLILSAIPLGLIANDIAHAIKDPAIATTDTDLSRAALLFSLHKTIGVTVFFVALARILWAIGQTKPGLLNGDNRLEAMAAETAHWLLYGSLVLVPLTGWIHHAATTGFAPIWWPFGQTLPFVPKDEGIAGLFATLHYILQWVLIGALTAHIAGALKHHLIDGDATLRRMLPRGSAAQPTAQQPGHVLPALAAIVIWSAAMGGGAALGWFPQTHAETAVTTQDGTAQRSAGDSEWQVQQGELAIAITQLGSPIEGQFADWTASIDYAETPDADGRHGAVTVSVAIPSLALGSVTQQAMGADYFNAEAHPTATFAAEIVSREGSHVATGTLTIKDQSVPVEMPFELTLEGDTAQASGGLSVDRRDWGIGEQGEGNVGATVDIRFSLTATRG